LKTFS